MQNAFFELFWFDFERCFWAARENRPFAWSFVVKQILNLFFWHPQSFKVVPYFPFTGSRVYVKLDLARRIHVPRAELRNLDDVRSESSDRLFKENSYLTTVQDIKVAAMRGDWPLAIFVKTDLGLASSYLFSSQKFQFRTETFLSVFLG